MQSMSLFPALSCAGDAGLPMAPDWSPTTTNGDPMKHHSHHFYWSGLAIAIALATQKCNDNSSTAPQAVVKDNAYYRALAEDMVAKMTHDEQLGMLVGPGYVFSKTLRKYLDALNNLKGDVPGSVGYINGVYNQESGLDIAASKLADGPAGVRIDSTLAGAVWHLPWDRLPGGYPIGLDLGP